MFNWIRNERQLIYEYVNRMLDCLVCHIWILHNRMRVNFIIFIYIWPYIERLTANMFVIFLLYINTAHQTPQQKKSSKNNYILYFTCARHIKHFNARIRMNEKWNEFQPNEENPNWGRKKDGRRKVPNMCAMMNIEHRRQRKNGKSFNHIIRSCKWHTRSGMTIQ